MTSTEIFPDDENGNVLRKLKERGDDLSKPRDIDFYFAFSTEQEAKNFVKQTGLIPNLRSKASRYEEREMWQARVTSFMTPTHGDITALESSLSHIALLHHGEPDGWGCLKATRSELTQPTKALNVP